jgi:Outer membrane lipoprotein carrier protein LolA-like
MNSGLIDVAVWLLAAVSATDEPNEIASLLESLAREPPQEIAFVEVRASPLVEGDITVSGVLEYTAPGKLSRVVTEPFWERTDISGDDVRIMRRGQRDRRFSLDRSPELAGLLTAFTALLAGDHDALERMFEVSYAPTREGWRLRLVPRRPRIADRIARISIEGTGDAPVCIAVVATNGAATTQILLGQAAAGFDRDAPRSNPCGAEP